MLPPKQPTFVAYYRVSTAKQGLGLDAQQAAVRAHITEGTLLQEFSEKETGKNNNRPQLAKAMRHCRMTGSTLVVAKLDRLSRNVHFLAQLMESKIPFICCDNPNATPLTLHILAAIAEHERLAISERTKSALAIAKKRGKKLGAAKGDMRVAPHARKGGAARAEQIIEDRKERYATLIEAGEGLTLENVMSWEALAEALTDRGLRSPRGNPISVAVCKRAFNGTLPDPGCAYFPKKPSSRAA